MLKSIKGLFKLQKLLLDAARIKKTIEKVKVWFDHFDGNEEEAAASYITTNLTKAMLAGSVNNEIKEENILMFRYCFHSAKNEAGEHWFDLFDLMIISFILSERDGFYQLEVDYEFLKRFMTLGIMEEDDLFELIAECKYRLEIRVHLTSLIMCEEKRVKELNRDFNICDDDTWRSCRFSRICQLMGEKLKDADRKKAFLDVFEAGYESRITYF